MLALNRHAFNTSRGQQVPFRTTVECEVSSSARRAPRVPGVMGTPPPPSANHRVGIRRADVGGSKRQSAPYKALGLSAPQIVLGKGRARRVGERRSESGAQRRAIGFCSGIASIPPPPRRLLCRVLRALSLPLPPAGHRTHSSRGRPELRSTPDAQRERPKGEQWP